ncbi:GNAT family N-acetyltransferase [Nocardioides mangrovicus]|uniref:GNAT family N-acetyltransferase n=1 Tax=Nocardioides mangrovicus TaxID=2478913 RepID=A0A3L8P0A7_9ACTN|nr:GNAT family N-acetyltransferase [Nocardioides mangrovicus]RLV48875.1 GNAT family N-acetyltransferase [Nocardioides mangrovicus]
MLRTQSGLRVLGAQDLPEVLDLLAADPVRNVFVDYRARLTRLEPRWLGGEIWGWFRDGRLASVCHAAANLVPAMADEEALDAFAGRARKRGRTCSTIVGPRDQVEVLWDRLSSHWGPARELRWQQPHLEISGSSDVEADPLVRRSEASDIETLYPACVAMYTEEVGVSPEWDGGRDLYRARVAQLVSRGWSFARYEEGRVVFKAEIACSTPHACQVQGVYVAPDRRGEGLATRGMAAVVELARREIAPVVSLYVNGHNTAARTAYDRAGFRQTETFATVMF